MRIKFPCSPSKHKQKIVVMTSFYSDDPNSSSSVPDLGRTGGQDDSIMDDDGDERKRLIQWEDGLAEESTDLGKYEGPSRRGGHTVYTYEEAVKSTGYGKFHAIILLLCGWAVSSDAVEVLSVSFLLPSATCELKMTSSDKGWLSAIVFVGMMFGGYFWGSLADKAGRRSILLWSLMVNGVGGLLSSVSQVFWLFLLMRFISGVGVGGSMPVIFSYFCEFQPRQKRGSMISVLATFWMGGNILAAGLAWIIIPLNIGYISPEFTYSSWRIFIAVCTAPALTSAFLFFLMPESPKFLLTVGKEEEAIQVLKQVHDRNNERQPFQVEALVLSEAEKESYVSVSERPIPKPENTSLKGRFSHLLDNSLELFRPPLLSRNVVLLIINFTLAFGYYGLFMWFPELFSRIEKFGGTPCDPGIVNSTIANSTTPDDGCQELSNNIFFEGFLTAVSNLPGNIFTIFLMDRLGRKLLLSTSMCLSGVAVFFIWFVQTRVQNVAISCVFGAVSTIGWNALDVLSTELFPTNVRTTAFGIQTGVARIGAILGNVIFGELVDIHCAVPMIMVAVLLCLGGLSAIKLPNTTGVDIH